MSAAAVVFVDTSGMYAVLDADDDRHSHAAAVWTELLDQLAEGTVTLMTSSVHLIEMTALVQSRLGMEAAKVLIDDIEPLFEIVWIDGDLHAQATTALLAADRRAVSLVDWCAFVIMRNRAIDQAFAYDDDFAKQGFALID